jgi:hypothetical protein
MGGLMSDTTYHALDTALGVDEVAVYRTAGDTASLIFFSGKRASNVAITRFSKYMNQYTPCKGYSNVPMAEVEAFLEEFEKALVLNKIRGQKTL